LAAHDEVHFIRFGRDLLIDLPGHVPEPSGYSTHRHQPKA
jgi:hypothetical protein